MIVIVSATTKPKMPLPELYKDTKNSRKGLQSQVNMQKNQEEK